MQNFFFHNPTRIIFGRSAVTQIGRETAVFGKRALLVYGKESIKHNGVYKTVINSLGSAGISIIEHGGVRPNPVLQHVRQGVIKAKENKVDVVVAAGGGSVIDSAKAICAGALVDHDVWLFFKGKKGIRKALPLTCVVTLAAAGSEMNGGMVLTNEKTCQKFGTGNKLLHPSASILDPTTTFTVPADYTAYGAVDAMSHVMEFYFTGRELFSPLQDRYSEGLIATIMESSEKALAEPENYEARANLMWGAALALNGIAAAGLGRVEFPMHTIEHSLSALYDVPHGAGLAVILPAWMEYTAMTKPDKFAQFAERVLGVTGGGTHSMAGQGVSRLRRWLEKINCPTRLANLGIPTAAITEIAENALALARLWRLRDYSREKFEAILKLCA